MKLLTQCQALDLVCNGKGKPNGEKDLKPIVKLFTPWAGATRLLSEINPENQDIAFCLCDLGHATLARGYVSLAEFRSLRGPDGLTVERDLLVQGRKDSLQAYADEARARLHRCLKISPMSLPVHRLLLTELPNNQPLVAPSQSGATIHRVCAIVLPPLTTCRSNKRQ